MEKLDLKIFRALRQEIIDFMNKERAVTERGENLSDEELEHFLARYREIIKLLSEHDLSDIDFEEWRGMVLLSDKDNPLDFSKTKANIDFSILEEYEAYKTFPNFKSCQIKNFNFEKYHYSPEMFDEEFRKENKERFLSENIPEEISDRFYKGELTLADIQNNPELANKIEEKNISYSLRYIFKIIGREEFCKLDAQFVDTTRLSWIELLNSNPNLRTAEEIMHVLYRSAREQIIGYKDVYYRQDQLGDRFREENPDLFLSEEVPERVREKYYRHDLSMREFGENLQHFEGKKVVQAFSRNDHVEKIISLYGEGIHQLFTNYKPLMYKILDDSFVRSSIEVPSGPITEDQRKKIMSSAVFTYITRHGFEDIHSWDEVKMIIDFISIEQLPLTPNAREFIEKYGIDTLLESGLDMKYLFEDSKLSSLKEIFSLKGIDIEDIKKLIDSDSRKVLESKELFKRFDSSTLLKLVTRNPESIQKMVDNHKEAVLENWYKSTGGKFVPHHVVMLNFPEDEIDSFLGNSKRWSQLMRIDNYNLNDDGKAAILKASYAMGVFQGDDDGFNKTMKLFTDVPQELTQEEYEKVLNMFNGEFDPFRWSEKYSDPQHQKDKEMKSLFEQAYTLNDDGKYVFSMDKQKNKGSVRMVREILEKAQIPRILTPEKAHQMFDSFAMEYNPDFVRFFNENLEEILSNPEYTKDIAKIQRQFKDIVRINAGRRLTLDVAQDYIKNIVYTDIEVGNEGVAEQAKIAGYSQKDFEAIQSLFNEGEVRDFSSIPRIQGSTQKDIHMKCLDVMIH